MIIKISQSLRSFEMTRLILKSSTSSTTKIDINLRRIYLILDCHGNIINYIFQSIVGAACRGS